MTQPASTASAHAAPTGVDHTGHDHAALDLDQFLPYRLSVLTNRISRGLAALYSERFDISVTEWRVIAVLGRYPGLSANNVAGDVLVGSRPDAAVGAAQGVDLVGE